VVEKGLELGERVVADGLDQLRPGNKVAPRDPAVAPGAAGTAAPPGGERGARKAEDAKR
jgi:hypothetical protein